MFRHAVFKKVRSTHVAILQFSLRLMVYRVPCKLHLNVKSSFLFSLRLRLLRNVVASNVRVTCSNQSERASGIFNQSGANSKPIVLAFSRAWPRVVIGSLRLLRLLWLARSEQLWIFSKLIREELYRSKLWSSWCPSEVVAYSVVLQTGFPELALAVL